MINCVKSFSNVKENTQTFIKNIIEPHHWTCFLRINNLTKMSPKTTVRLSHQIFNYFPVGKRSLGKSFKRWKETVTDL